MVITDEDRRKPYITWDPGLSYSGLAYFKDKLENWDLVSCTKCRGLGWLQRAQLMAELVLNVTRYWCGQRCLTLVVEQPHFMGSALGHASAVRGDLGKLMLLIGIVAGRFGDTVKLVPVNQWKGQLPKAVVAAQVLEILGKRVCSAFERDVWDAVGLGLWVKGQFPIRSTDRRSHPHATASRSHRSRGRA